MQNLWSDVRRKVVKENRTNFYKLQISMNQEHKAVGQVLVQKLIDNMPGELQRSSKKIDASESHKMSAVIISH